LPGLVQVRVPGQGEMSQGGFKGLLGEHLVDLVEGFSDAAVVARGKGNPHSAILFLVDGISQVQVKEEEVIGGFVMEEEPVHEEQS
jgi:hypothetical protein